MPPATTAAVLDTIATSAGDSTAAFDDGAAWYVVFDVEMLLSRTVHPVIPVSFRSACRSSSSAGDTAFTAQFTVLITSDVLQLSVTTHWIPTSTSHDPLDDSAYSNTAIFDASTHSSRARSATHDFGSAPAYVTVSTIRSGLNPPSGGSGAGISRHSAGSSSTHDPDDDESLPDGAAVVGIGIAVVVVVVVGSSVVVLGVAVVVGVVVVVVDGGTVVVVNGALVGAPVGASVPYVSFTSAVLSIEIGASHGTATQLLAAAR